MADRGVPARVLVTVGAAILLGSIAWWLLARTPSGEPLDPPTTDTDRPDAGRGPALNTSGAEAPAAIPEPRRGEGRIRGVVLDAQDAPVVGVEVVARRSSEFARRDRFEVMHAPALRDVPDARDRTDERGFFTLAGLDLSVGSGPGAVLPHFVVTALVDPPRACTSANVANWGPVREQAIVLRVLEGRPVRVRVVDAHARGVQAVLYAHADAQDARPGAWTRWSFGPQATDPEGRLLIPCVPAAALRFDVHVGGRLRVGGLRADVPADGELLLRLGGGGPGSVVGRVLDSAGDPVARAQVLVEVEGEAARTWAAAATDAEGTYRMEDLAPGIVGTVRARAAGLADGVWRDVGRDVRAGAETRLDLTLLAGARLAGRVLDERGKPVAGARVATYTNRVYPSPEGLTDAAGRYEIAGLAPGTYDLYVQARGYYDEKGPQVSESAHGRGVSWRGSRAHDETYRLEVRAAGERLTRDFVVRRGRPLSGRVLGVDGAPAVGAEVRWRQAAKPPPGESVPPGGLTVVAVTDADGRFGHPGLGPPEGLWLLDARTPDACSEQTVMDAFEEPLDVTLQLRPLASVAGRVVDRAGALRPLVTVRLDAAGGTVALGLTDAEGRFLFEGLEPASYTLSVLEAPERHWRETGVSETFGLAPGQARTDLEIASTPARGRDAAAPRPPAPAPAATRLVEGTVLAPDGEPVASGSVTVRPNSGRSRTGGVLGGRFGVRIDADATTITFEVLDPRDGMGRAIVHAPFGLADQPATAGPFTLRLSAGGVIAGRVVDEQDVGIPGVTLEVDMGRRNFRSRGGPFARTDADGAFRLEGLGVGLQRIRVTIDEAYVGPREVSLAIGTTDALVRYTRGGVIAGRVVGPDGEGVGNVELAAMPADGSRTHWKNGHSGADGTFRIVGLAADLTYTVRARPWERDVGRGDLLHAYVEEVRPDREDLVLRLLAGVYVEGTLLLPDGTPAEGHRVGAFAEGDEGGKMPVETDERGAFRVGPFVPGTSVTVTGYAPDKTVRPAWERGVAAPSTGLVLRLTQANSRAGRVEGENLVGFRWLWVAGAAGEGEFPSWKGGVEADGRLLLTQLPEKGAVTVYVFGRDDDRYALARNVTHEGAVLELALAQGHAIEGQVDATVRARETYLPFLRCRSLALGFDRSVDLTTDGAFRIRGLPPGRYEIVLHDPQGKAAARAEADAGAEGVVVR